MSINNEPKWVDVDCVGLSGKRYFGRFMVKPFLELGERADAARLASVYSRGIEEGFMKMVMTAVANLKFHIIKTDADWWVDDGLRLLDNEPIDALVGEISKLQNPGDSEEKDTKPE